MIEQRFVELISSGLSVRPGQVEKAIELLEGGATIPFITRYRKDITGGLDEVKLEVIAERNSYFIGLTERRKSVLESIAKQDKLTDELRHAIENCVERTTLEDLYLPYKKKQRTKATVAREKGLTPLADFLWEQASTAQTIEEFAATFVRAEKAIATVEEALEGAAHILAERIANDTVNRQRVREVMTRDGKIQAHPTKNAEGQKTKYETYYNFSEPVTGIPSHRLLAILRGAKEGVLRMELVLDDNALIEALSTPHITAPGTPFEPFLRRVFEDSYYRLLRPSVESEVVGLARDRAEQEAIQVFRENAQNLLLASPAGQIVGMGIDPGLRTGCKLAVVGPDGAYLESAIIFPTPPHGDVENAEKVLLALMEKHNVKAIAIGNGTGARETSRFVRAALAKVNRDGVFSVLVNEAGASVYSTSKIAREEFPDLDPTIRSAIAIARRLQDPLAELVKIEPRHIGVGQYQHDVNQKRLRECLQRTVTYCVNQVGVELNTASEPLLRHISGIQANVAKNIVQKRTELGRFQSRTQLMEVEGIGPRVFQQCAGFIRIANGENVLDNTGIHPEAYEVVERIAQSLQTTPVALVEKPELLEGLDLRQFQTDTVGELALADISVELAKPGRDPRTEFRVPKFIDGVDTVEALEEGMEAEGVVTNVTDFGAFVDIGVHQDGLVHLSELAHRFVKDPREVIRVGEIVRVKVIKVDKELPRISLSRKALLPPPEPKPPRAQGHRHESGPRHPARTAEGEPRERQERGAGQARRRRDDGREQRPESRGDRMRKRGMGAQKDSHHGRPHKRHEDSAPLNTQLADQLAALKEKFGR